jgi:hypothetical protein
MLVNGTQTRAIIANGITFFHQEQKLQYSVVKSQERLGGLLL